MKNKKVVVGIEIDEILRAKWLQFDRYYVEEFGEAGVPEQPYCYNYFKNYNWSPMTETLQELKEPDDMPENINPIDYVVDEKTGESDADFLLFKKAEKNELTPEQVYNRFMYEDFMFEIFASAPMMYKNMDSDVVKFIKKYNDVEFVVISKENLITIPATLFFLSKTMSRFKNYKFIDSYDEVWDSVDVFITTNPDVFDLKPIDKKLITLKRPYNIGCYSDIDENITHLNDLTESEKFKKILENYEK